MRLEYYEIFDSNTKQVRILIESGARTTLCDRLGFDCASYAAKFSRTECMRTFFEFSKNQFTKNVCSTNYLQLCISSKNSDLKSVVECFEWLVSKGVDISNSHHDSGRTLLMNSIQTVNRSVERIDFVVQAIHKSTGTPIVDIVNEKAYPKTMLWKFFRQYTNVSSLFRLGNLYDRRKNPAMFSLQLLWGTTALHFAFGAGCAPIVYRLVELGADVNAKNDLGMSCMDFAALFGHRESMSEVWSVLTTMKR